VGVVVGRLSKRIDAGVARNEGGQPCSLACERRRSGVATGGVVRTSVEVLKPGAEKNFCVVEAAMNDLMRPTLYQAWMGVQPVTPRDGEKLVWDIVGPVCESGDWLARERELALEPGDLLAIMTAGAYGMTMASNYNTRGRAAEVIVDGDATHLVRRRETPAEVFALETMMNQA